MQQLAFAGETSRRGEASELDRPGRGLGVGAVVGHQQRRQAGLAGMVEDEAAHAAGAAAWSSLAKGSSSSSARGSASSVRISATRARWPPDSVAGSRRAKPASSASRERGLDPRPALAPAAHRARQGEGQVLADREMREQQVVLEQDAEPAALRRQALERDAVQPGSGRAPRRPASSVPQR